MGGLDETALVRFQHEVGEAFVEQRSFITSGFADLRLDMRTGFQRADFTIERLSARLEAFVLGQREINSRFEQRFDGVEQRLDVVEQRLDRVEQRLDRVEQRLDRVEQRLDRMEQRLDSMEQRLDSMDAKLDRLLAATSPRPPRTRRPKGRRRR